MQLFQEEDPLLEIQPDHNLLLSNWPPFIFGRSTWPVFFSSEVTLTSILLIFFYLRSNWLPAFIWNQLDQRSQALQKGIFARISEVFVLDHCRLRKLCRIWSVCNKLLHCYIVTQWIVCNRLGFHPKLLKHGIVGHSHSTQWGGWKWAHFKCFFSMWFLNFHLYTSSVSQLLHCVVTLILAYFKCTFLMYFSNFYLYKLLHCWPLFHTMGSPFEMFLFLQFSFLQAGRRPPPVAGMHCWLPFGMFPPLPVCCCITLLVSCQWIAMGAIWNVSPSPSLLLHCIVRYNPRQ